MSSTGKVFVVDVMKLLTDFVLKKLCSLSLLLLKARKLSSLNEN